MGASRRTPAEFFRKYFVAGQKREADAVSLGPSAFDKFMEKHRKIIAILTPIIFVQTVYWLLATEYGFYKLFTTRYEMSLVMIFGSFVGGATAEGGGAIAFPVLTLAFKTPATVARDFSVMIQTVGMNSGATSIRLMDLIVEKHALIICTIGGAFGTVLCLEVLDDVVPQVAKKIIFVSVFFSFAVALFLLNRQKKRITYDQIPHFNGKDALVLLFTGFFGGLFSGLCGSGLEVFAFSVITLLYRINEKVATPTTLSLSGLNSAIAFFWRYHMQHAIEPLAWEYFAVCAPIVVIFAPIGTLLSSYLHRQTLACFIYVLETVALVSAFIILHPAWTMWLMSFLIILFASSFYFVLSWIGGRNARVAPTMLPSVATINSVS